MISVVIPVYNSQQYLEKCLDSILNQTNKALEVICVDDKSTDLSLKMLKEYTLKDKRVKVFENPSRGVSAARNFALEICSGEYVLFVDSDDWIDLDICSEAFEAAEREKADVVIWSYIREYAGHSKPRYILGTEEKIYQNESLKTLYRRMYGLTDSELSQPENANTLITVWGKLYRREKIKSVRFTDLKYIGTSEDTLFNIEVFREIEKVVYLPKCAYHYRKTNSASVTTQYNPALYKQWENLYTKMERTIPSGVDSNKYREALLNRIALGMIPYVLNVTVSEHGIKKQIEEIRTALLNRRYQEAFANLQIKWMPVHWKIFFIFAKTKFSLGVLFLGEIMQFMRGR